jgi:hypothetical protein
MTTRSKKIPRYFHPRVSRAGSRIENRSQEPESLVILFQGNLEHIDNSEVEIYTQSLVDVRGGLGGAKKVDSTLERMVVTIQALGAEITCDFTNAASASEQCWRLLEKSLPPLEEYDDTSTAGRHRLLSFVPSFPVYQGDSWDRSLNIDEMGEFIGQAEFAGFKEFDGSKVAVISLQGVVNCDLEQLVANGHNMAGLGLNSFHITAGNVTGKIYWDDEYKLVRWLELIGQFEMVGSSLGAANQFKGTVKIVVQATSEVVNEQKDAGKSTQPI